MSCVFCGKEERNADENKQYSCGSCTARVIGLDADGRQQLLDDFYLNDQAEAAEFLECVFFGQIRSRHEVRLRRRIL